jgi:transposase
VSAFPSGVTIACLREVVTMDVLYERCAGLDVHQETVVCCVLISEPGGRCRKEFRTFGTMTGDLEALRDWLRDCGVSHVAMESTGVFWKPVYAVLEGHVEIVVGNAQHIRNVPGRKTDIKDAEWLGQLLRHGLIRASFVPPPEFRELRELLRFRRGMVQEPTQSDDPAPAGADRRKPEPGRDGRSGPAADARQAAGSGPGA